MIMGGEDGRKKNNATNAGGQNGKNREREKQMRNLSPIIFYAHCTERRKF